MTMEDEAICRVCRLESTADHPLFHPCKCSGSIRFVHQDCLIEWLAHSKKKYCELCEYPFVFSPIYRSDMPDRLPVDVIVRQCVRRVVKYVKLLVRGLVVGIVWLVILPYSTLWTWRFYFWSGETITMLATPGQADHAPGAQATAVATLFDTTNGNDTSTLAPVAAATTWFSRFLNFLTFPIVFQWRDFFSDCFEGQVITAVVIVIFIAAYLFREWVVQNMPLDDDMDMEPAAHDHDHDHDQEHEHDHDHDHEHHHQHHHHHHHHHHNDHDDHNDNDDDDDDEPHPEALEQPYAGFTRTDAYTHIGPGFRGDTMDATDAPTDGQHRDDDDDAELLQQQQVAIDTLLNAIHTIQSPEMEIELERDELQARLTHMRHMLQLKRQADGNHDDENDDDVPPLIDMAASSSSGSARRNGKARANTIDPSEQDEDDVFRASSSSSSWKRPPFTSNDNDITDNDTFDALDDARRRSPSPATTQQPMPPQPPLPQAAAQPHAARQDVFRMPPPPIDFPDADQNADEDMEPFDFADDIDGVLEAVGMRGNPWMLLQNSVLMSLMVSLCLAVAVWIPYIVGRLVVSIQPVQFIQTPISIMRLVTDPIVDFVLDRGVPAAWAWVALQLQLQQHLVPERVQVASRAAMKHVTDAWTWVQQQLLQQPSTVSVPPVSHPASTSSFFSSLWPLSRFQSNGASSTPGHVALPDFLSPEAMQQYQDQAEEWLGMALDRWHGFARGQAAIDRTVCILMGYLVLILIGAWYLGRANARLQQQQQQRRRNQQQQQQQPQQQQQQEQGQQARPFVAAAAAQQQQQQQPNPQNPPNQPQPAPQQQHGDSIHDILRQQGDFLKVVFFIVIELVIFPFACGVLLDIGTLPLFQGASAASRWAFYQTSPYSSCFLHWFFGTGFLFGVAVFVALCREVVRPGVIWFIRDPNDPQFHPIREMIERPTLPLLQKIVHSVLMYSCLIFAAVIVNVELLNYVTSAFPLYVPLDKPFSTLALDLLAIQFLLSPLMSYLQPRDYAKSMLDIWWRWVSRQLRLTSFFFGTRVADEEGVHERHTLTAWLLRKKAFVQPYHDDDDAMTNVTIHDPVLDEHDGNNNDVIFVRNGQLMRVPKMDTVPVDPHRPMLVPIDPVHLEPIDEHERLNGLHAAAAQSGDEDISTMIVYTPPHFNLRILAFIFCMWLSSSILTWMMTVAPVCLGRWVLGFLVAASPSEVHDIYSFAVGMYAMVSLGLIAHWVHQRPDLTADWCMRHAVLAGKACFLVLTLGLAVPLLLGITVDLYVFMPLRYARPEQPMVLHVSEDWAFGVAFLSIGYGLLHTLPANAWQQYIDDVFPPVGGAVADAHEFLTALSVSEATRSFVAPAMFVTILAIAIPGILAWGCFQLLDPPLFYLIRWIYPIVFCILFVVAGAYLSTTLVKLCVKSIRDDTYLVGKQLHNLES